MTVSSRTPEGLPSHCVLCGKDFQLEFSNPRNDATCPNCGHLIILSADVFNRLESILGRRQGALTDKIRPSQDLSSVGNDSLETVEFVMELEEEFELSISEHDVVRIRTIGDVVRYILDQRRLREGK